MEPDFDPIEAWTKVDAIGRALTDSEPLAISSGFAAVKSGALTSFGSSEMAVYTLAPPTMYVQRVEQETMALVGPPLTFDGDEIAKVTFADLPVAVEAKLKLSDGRRLKMGIANSGLYGDDGPAELCERLDENCDAIVAWLVNPS